MLAGKMLPFCRRSWATLPPAWRLVRTASSRAETSKDSVLTAQVFIDLNWLDGKLTDIASKKHGKSFDKKATVDAAPLRPFLEEKASSAFNETVKISHMYAYGVYNQVTASNRPLVDFVRVMTEEGVTVRTFGTQYPQTWAPAVALAVDCVHACAIQGDVDTGTPIRSRKPSPSGASGEQALNLGPTDAVIIVGGSNQYFPALVRACQHGRRTALATTSLSWRNMSGALVRELADVTVPLLLDGALHDMVTPLEAFQAGAPTLEELARLVHGSLGASVGIGSVVSGPELAAVLARNGLLKALRRQGCSIRAVVASSPGLFTLLVDPVNPVKWSVATRQPPVSAAVVRTAAPAAAGAPPHEAAASASTPGAPRPVSPLSPAPSNAAPHAQQLKRENQQERGKQQQQQQQMSPQPKQTQSASEHVKRPHEALKKRPVDSLPEQKQQQQQQQQVAPLNVAKGARGATKDTPAAASMPLAPAANEAEAPAPAPASMAATPVVVDATPASAPVGEEARPVDAAVMPAAAPVSDFAAPVEVADVPAPVPVEEATPEVPTPAPVVVEEVSTTAEAEALPKTETAAAPSTRLRGRKPKSTQGDDGKGTPAAAAAAAAPGSTEASRSGDPVAQLLQDAHHRGLVPDVKVKIANLRALLALAGTAAAPSLKLEALKDLVAQSVDALKARLHQEEAPGAQ